MSDERYESFSEFFPFYLSEHSHPLNRWLHFTGTTLGAAILVAASTIWTPWTALLAPVVGYGFAWFGHFMVERNEPASFSHPWWSFLGDLRMYGLMLTGRAEKALEDYFARGEVHSLRPGRK